MSPSTKRFSRYALRVSLPLAASLLALGLALALLAPLRGDFLLGFTAGGSGVCLACLYHSYYSFRFVLGESVDRDRRVLSSMAHGQLGKWVLILLPAIALFALNRGAGVGSAETNLTANGGIHLRAAGFFAALILGLLLHAILSALAVSASR